MGSRYDEIGRKAMPPPAALPQPPQLLHRPIPEHGLAIDVALVNGAKVAAVVRHGAMIAQHKVAVRRNDHFAIGASVGIIGGHVVLVERFAIDVDLPVFDADVISRHANYALDVALGGIAGVAEHHDVASLDWLPAIDELVDEDPFLVFKARHHAGAFDFH